MGARTGRALNGPAHDKLPQTATAGVAGVENVMKWNGSSQPAQDGMIVDERYLRLLKLQRSSRCSLAQSPVWRIVAVVIALIILVGFGCRAEGTTGVLQGTSCKTRHLRPTIVNYGVTNLMDFQGKQPNVCGNQAASRSCSPLSLVRQVWPTDPAARAST
jgi:hypothetical protein